MKKTAWPQNHWRDTTGLYNDYVFLVTEESTGAKLIANAPMAMDVTLLYDDDKDPVGPCGSLWVLVGPWSTWGWDKKVPPPHLVRAPHAHVQLLWWI